MSRSWTIRSVTTSTSVIRRLTALMRRASTASTSCSLRIVRNCPTAGLKRSMCPTSTWAPLEGAEPYLVGTVDHSVLGTRWVYDAMADPVATACFLRALEGEQQQAEVHLYAEDGQYIGHESSEVSR